MCAVTLLRRVDRRVWVLTVLVGVVLREGDRLVLMTSREELDDMRRRITGAGKGDAT